MEEAEEVERVPYLVQRTRHEVVVKVSGTEKVVTRFYIAEASDGRADAELAKLGYERDMVWVPSIEEPRRWTSARRTVTV